MDEGEKRQKEIARLLKSAKHGESLTDIIARNYQTDFERKAVKAWHDLWFYGKHPSGQESLTPQTPKYRVEARVPPKSKWLVMEEGLAMKEAIVRRTEYAEEFGAARIINERTDAEEW